MKSLVTFFILLYTVLILFAGYHIRGWVDGNNKEINESLISTKHVAGAKILHHNWIQDKHRVSFITESFGKGKIETSFPKTIIPEAKSYIERIHCLQVTYSGIFVNNEYHHGASISFWRRFGKISVGGGVQFSSGSVGFNIGSQIWY